MKVRELIDELKKLNPELPVMTACNEGYCDVNHIYNSKIVLGARTGSEPWDHRDYDDIVNLISVLGNDTMFKDKIEFLKSKLITENIVDAVIL